MRSRHSRIGRKSTNDELKSWQPNCRVETLPRLSPFVSPIPEPHGSCPMSPTSVLVDPALLSPHPIRRPSGSSPSSLSIPKTPLTPSKRRQSERELEHASNPSIAVVDGWVGSKKQRGLGSDSVGNSKPTPTEQVERAPASVDGLAPSSVNDSAPSSVGPEANIKELPHHYMDADINDLVILIGRSIFVTRCPHTFELDL